MGNATRAREVIRSELRELADLVFPRFCIETGRPVPGGSAYRYLHPDAVSRLLIVGPPHCLTCGHPFWGVPEENAICPHCEDLRPWFETGRTAALMRDPARRLILELKYHGGLYVIPDLIAMAGAAPGFLQFLEGAQLIPVPLHRKRLQQRGFNQSRLLAMALVRKVSRGAVADLLVRTRNTSTQTRLRREDRRKNMEGAFALKPGGLLDPQQRYVVFDDVFTTGATLNACARVLRKAGATQVDVATLCHG